MSTLSRVHGLRGILQSLLLRVGLATLLVLLLLGLDGLLALLSKEHLLVGLILLVLAHQLVELLLSILHLRHQVLRGIPRQPRTDLANVQVVLRVAALEHLREHLGLLHRRERTTNLDAADIRTELHAVIVHLLEILLVLEKEDLVLLADVRLLDLILAHCHKVLRILQEVVNLDRVLLGQKGHEVLQTLDLPLVVHPLHELLKVELLLVLDHLLRADEGHNAVLLRRHLGVLVKVVDRTRLIALRKLGAGHLLFPWVPLKVLSPQDINMYDIFTTAYLFFLLCPGVVLSLGSGLMGAAIHAVVFFVILQYLSLYIPWWAIWVVGVSFVSYKVYSGGV